MHICYIDESGDAANLTSATCRIQPVFAILGICFDHQRIHRITDEFISLKRRFFPRLFPPTIHHLDSILHEIKGTDIRRTFRLGTRNQRRHAIGFLDNLFGLIERNNGYFLARIWIKGVGQSFDGRSTYTYSMQNICQSFNQYLWGFRESGIVIADSRSKALNANVAHSVFTKKYRIAGDAFPRIIEMPTFGHSENHAGIQIADLICSSLLFPIAAWAYCAGHVRNVHVQPRYRELRERFGRRIEYLQFRYPDASGRMRGGITVSDAISKNSSVRLFRP